MRWAIDEEPQSRSRSLQWHWWHQSFHYQVRLWYCQRRAELTRASVRRARGVSGVTGAPPARQATEMTLGSWAEQ